MTPPRALPERKQGFHWSPVLGVLSIVAGLAIGTYVVDFWSGGQFFVRGSILNDARIGGGIAVCSLTCAILGMWLARNERSRWGWWLSLGGLILSAVTLMGYAWLWWISMSIFDSNWL
jgi:ABC-type Fe3+ transport system permease subunit